MVTGDNVLTARAIAAECNILTPDGIVIEGKDFRVMSEEKMIDIIPRIDVRAHTVQSCVNCACSAALCEVHIN